MNVVHEYYLTRGDRKFGPFSAAQLRGVAASGQLRPKDTVWREGLARPVLVSRLTNLSPAPPRVDAAAPAGTPALPSAPDQPGPEAVSAGAGPVPVAVPFQFCATAPPGKAAPSAGLPARPPEPVRKRRAVAVKGAILVSQDGQSVHYRKKCTQCGHEDGCRSTMPIGNGTTRTHFFCTKCRKSREVILQGFAQ